MQNKEKIQASIRKTSDLYTKNNLTFKDYHSELQFLKTDKNNLT